MQNISLFTLYPKQAILEIKVDQATSKENPLLSYTYEYLRVFSPSELQKENSNKKTTLSPIPQVFHKKNVQISAIEPLGKHGHRFIFDDGFTDIYSTAELLDLSKSFDKNWEQYLNSLTPSQSREESINFKAVT